MVKYEINLYRLEPTFHYGLNSFPVFDIQVWNGNESVFERETKYEFNATQAIIDQNSGFSRLNRSIALTNFSSLMKSNDPI